jgi:hypothetical protein
MKLLETELEIFPVSAIGAKRGEPGEPGSEWVNFGKKRGETGSLGENG